jgi:hypothetical protein
LKRILRFLNDTYRKRITLTCIVFVLLVAVADYVTGKHIRFPILYLLPAALAARLNRKAIAYSIAVMFPMLRLGFAFSWHQTESLLLMTINLLIRVATLVLVVYLVDRTMTQARRLGVLEGILPICASCKRIRNEKGDYEQMEKYITEHSGALFSHDLCPECLKKLYHKSLDDEEK